MKPSQSASTRTFQPTLRPIPYPTCLALRLLLGASQGVSGAAAEPSILQTTASTINRRVLVLSASQTGNARSVAESLHAKLQAVGVEARLSSAGDFKSKPCLTKTSCFWLPPPKAKANRPKKPCPCTNSSTAKRNPNLSKLTFAVLGLGDSSYPNFCQAGKDFDAKFAELGAGRLNDLGICDLEFSSRCRRMDCRRRTQSGRVSRPSNKPKYNRRTKRLSNTKQRHRVHQRKTLHSHPIRAPKNHLSRRRERRRTHRNRPQRLRSALSGRRRARRMAA